MTQALYTSMTGLNAGTEQLTVVSDNVANMNTTAYKTSRVDFQDIWYQTTTTGTNSTPNSGGTNPYQIGVGVQCASISKDFGAASTVTTGRAEDMAITGDGWFSVINADGQVLLTRDGTFSLDENGYICNIKPEIDILPANLFEGCMENDKIVLRVPYKMNDGHEITLIMNITLKQKEDCYKKCGTFEEAWKYVTSAINTSKPIKTVANSCEAAYLEN